MGSDYYVISSGPGRPLDRELGPLLNDLTRIVVAGAPEGDKAGLSALLGDRTGASQGLKGLWAGKALAIIAKHGQQGRFQVGTCGRQGLVDGTIRVLAIVFIKLRHQMGFGMHHLKQHLRQQPGLLSIHFHNRFRRMGLGLLRRA